jgi:hypothetical protein
VPISPIGGTVLDASSYNEYVWQRDPAATWYELYVTHNGKVFCDQWFALSDSVDQVNFAVDVGGHTGGAYQWWVRGWSADGLGPWCGSIFSIRAAVPGAVGLVGPTMNHVAINAPGDVIYVWFTDPAATWYELYVTCNGKVFCDKWYQLSDSVSSDPNSFTVDVSGHGAGTYQWWVRGWSPDGLGPWSSAGNFTMPSPHLPGAVTLLTPAAGDNGVGRQPQFTWTASGNMLDEWYYLYVTRNGSKYLDQWIKAADGRTWTPTAALPAGNYTWYVRAWNIAGYGPWSLPGSTFTINFALPGTISLISPSVTATGATQRYTWQPDPAATWYELYVAQNGTVFMDKWFTLTDSVDTSGNFSVDVDGHTAGNYQWYVRGWGPDGLGPWSGPLTFTLTY